MKSQFYFFVGTTAEFLKVMPVMRELSTRGVPFKIISSGQNKLQLEDVFPLSGAQRIDYTLNSPPVRKSALGLLAWFARTIFKGIGTLRREFRGLRGRGVLIVHGDTVSTVMGALIGKYYGLRVAHVEAGLRSFNFLQPFPEELDRYITSFLADIHFCPLESAVRNLQKRRGVKIGTGFNTNIDSLALALDYGKSPPILKTIGNVPYCIFIMHRQENLLDKTLTKETVRSVLEASSHIKCVFVMHDLTRSVLEQLQLLDEISKNPNVILAERMPFLEFIELLKGCEFIVTDGGGNQQEAYYLGKPCLLLRKVTEGNEGLGHNIVLGKHDVSVLREFTTSYARYRRPQIQPAKRPSEIIADALLAK